MNCNCCNCSNNNVINCEDENRKKIKIYGTLVNTTLDNTLDDANCAADNQDYDTGHNDAIAYAYQIHDGRFRADDENLPAHRRFQDDINRRITNIDYDPENNVTLIFNKETNEWEILKNGDSTPYDDAWLKDIIGTTPDGEQAASNTLQGDFDEESGDIISYIRLLKQKLCDLQVEINNLKNGGACLWTECNGNGGAGICPKNNKVVYGPGFYDTEVSNA